MVALGEPGKTPVELALLFDVSGSVFQRFQFQQQAASRFLKEALKPNDATSIFTIGLSPNAKGLADPSLDYRSGWERHGVRKARRCQTA
ncbi:MAG TPA: hypothetical protein VJ810_25350 [Blastocatellia bacterium]|nr:hypothetical protein [Blastocatellia bacterium]